MSAAVDIREDRPAVDLALLVIRIFLGGIFIYHGSRRLFGWFDGPGLHASGEYFANTAHLHPALSPDLEAARY